MDLPTLLTLLLTVARSVLVVSNMKILHIKINFSEILFVSPFYFHFCTWHLPICATLSHNSLSPTHPPPPINDSKAFLPLPYLYYEISVTLLNENKYSHANHKSFPHKAMNVHLEHNSKLSSQLNMKI